MKWLGFSKLTSIQLVYFHLDTEYDIVQFKRWSFQVRILKSRICHFTCLAQNEALDVDGTIAISRIKGKC